MNFQCLQEYLTKLKTLWELGAYLALPNYNCTKDFNNLNRFLERERMHQFLIGLNTEQFETVVESAHHGTTAPFK